MNVDEGLQPYHTVTVCASRTSTVCSTSSKINKNGRVACQDHYWPINKNGVVLKRPMKPKNISCLFQLLQ